jgi:hypothetical protein
VIPNPHNLPDDVMKEYGTVANEVLTLRMKWNVFLQLYGTASNVETLNSSAPGFFYLCQDAFVDSIILTISRLTEKAQTGSKRNPDFNLSLLHLVARAQTEMYADSVDKLQQAVSKVKQKCDPIQLTRNRRIAHLDLQTHLLDASMINVKRNAIQSAVDAIIELMALLDFYFTGESIFYDDIPAGDGRHLLIRLRNAKKYWIDQEQRDIDDRKTRQTQMQEAADGITASHPEVPKDQEF